VWSAGKTTFLKDALQLGGPPCPAIDVAATPQLFELNTAGTTVGINAACTPTIWPTPTTPTYPDKSLEGTATAISPKGTWIAGTDTSGVGGIGLFRRSADHLRTLTSPLPGLPAVVNGINDIGLTTGQLSVPIDLQYGLIGPDNGVLRYADDLIAPGQCGISDVGPINDHNQALAEADCVTGGEIIQISPPPGWKGFTSLSNTAERQSVIDKDLGWNGPTTPAGLEIPPPGWSIMPTDLAQSAGPR
jgi:hypothetical protein